MENFGIDCIYGNYLGQGLNTLLLRLIQEDLCSGRPNRRFHTPTGLLNCQTLILMPVCQGGRQFVLFHDGLWYNSGRARSHDLPHGRRTR